MPVRSRKCLLWALFDRADLRPKKVAEIAESMASQGQLHAIVIRPNRRDGTRTKFQFRDLLGYFMCWGRVTEVTLSVITLTGGSHSLQVIQRDGRRRLPHWESGFGNATATGTGGRARWN